MYIYVHSSLYGMNHEAHLIYGPGHPVSGFYSSVSSGVMPVDWRSAA
jgi:hypothetical protein